MRACDTSWKTDCNIDAFGAVVLSQVLMTNKTLTSIDLKGLTVWQTTDVSLFPWHDEHTENKIGDAGAQALSESLKTNSTLRVLYLRSLWFLSHWYKRLSIKACPCLPENNIKRKGVSAVFDMLEHNKALQELDLSGLCFSLFIISDVLMSTINTFWSTQDQT